MLAASATSISCDDIAADESIKPQTVTFDICRLLGIRSRSLYSLIRITDQDFIELVRLEAVEPNPDVRKGARDRHLGAGLPSHRNRETGNFHSRTPQYFRLPTAHSMRGFRDALVWERCAWNRKWICIRRAGASIRGIQVHGSSAAAEQRTALNIAVETSELKRV